MKIFAIIALAVTFSGCAGFSGKRGLIFEMTIFGSNSIKWESTCDGDYQAPEPKEEDNVRPAE